jgi:hypothetical protein
MFTEVSSQFAIVQIDHSMMALLRQVVVDGEAPEQRVRVAEVLYKYIYSFPGKLLRRASQ